MLGIAWNEINKNAKRGAYLVANFPVGLPILVMYSLWGRGRHS